MAKEWVIEETGSGNGVRVVPNGGGTLSLYQHLEHIILDECMVRDLRDICNEILGEKADDGSTRKLRLLAVAQLRTMMRSNRDDDLVRRIAEAFGIDLQHAKDTGEEVE